MTRDDGYFQDYIENLFQQKGYPGMAISIRGPEGILFERGFGYRDIENEKPADQDTMFGIASMSKSLTALACCFCGYYLDLYNHSPYVFDRSLHAFGAFSFSLTAYCIIAGVTQPGGSLLFRALFVFCIGNTLGAVFELLEAAHDSKKNVPVKGQKGLQDTNMDMLFNAIGSLLAGVFSYFFPLP